MGIRLVDGTRESSTYMQLVAASPGFLEALGARLVAGRTLDQRDLQGDTPTVVISRSVARALFSGRDAVGQDMPARGLGANPRPPRVVGIVEDVHYSGLGTAADNAVYMPWQQLPLGVVSLVVRTAGDPRQIVPARPWRCSSRWMRTSRSRARGRCDSLAGLSIADRRLQIATAAAFALLTLTLAAARPGLGADALGHGASARARHPGGDWRHAAPDPPADPRPGRPAVRAGPGVRRRGVAGDDTPARARSLWRHSVRSADFAACAPASSPRPCSRA